MSIIPYKGKTSMANKSEQLEQVDSSPEVRTIRLLQNKYGEERGSVHTEVGETKSGLFWQLESGHCVRKDHECLPAYLPACLPACLLCLPACLPASRTKNETYDCTWAQHKNQTRAASALLIRVDFENCGCSCKASSPSKCKNI